MTASPVSRACVRGNRAFSAMDVLVGGLLLSMAAAAAVAAWTQFDRIPAERRKLQRARSVARSTVEWARASQNRVLSTQFDCDSNGRRVATGSQAAVYRVDIERAALPGSKAAGTVDGLDEIHVRVTERSSGATLDDLRVWVTGVAP